MTFPTHLLGSCALLTVKESSSTRIRNRVAHMAQHMNMTPMPATNQPAHGAISPRALWNEAPISAIRPRHVKTAHQGQKLVSRYARIRVNDCPTCDG